MEKNTVIRKYSYLLERFDKTKEIKKMYESEKNESIKETFYMGLQRAIEEVLESSIKLNIYILKKKGIFPKTYLESFTLLKNNIDLPEDQILQLSKFAKFRNILAHEYQDLSSEATIEQINKIIKLYPKYLKGLKKVLN